MKHLWRDQRGAVAAEYSMILAMVGIGLAKGGFGRAPSWC
jgi:Flp pilus assembly pilin Flp